MVRQLHGFNRYEFEQTLGDSEEQRSLACSYPWGHRVQHILATEQQQLIHFAVQEKVIQIVNTNTPIKLIKKTKTDKKVKTVNGKKNLYKILEYFKITLG